MMMEGKFIDFLFSFSPIARLLFPCFLLFLGISFEGSEHSPIYKIFMVVVGSIVIAYTFIKIICREIYLGVSVWTMIVGLPLFFAVDYYWETGTKILNEGVLQDFIMLMLCFAYTSICCGVYMAQEGIGKFVKWWDIIMVFFNLAFLIYIPAAMLSVVKIGLMSYQTMSYMTGFVFLLNLCMILWGDKYERFRFFSSSNWKVFSYVLLVVQLLACLLSTGRGGFVVLAAGSVYMLVRSKKIGKVILSGIIGGMCVLGITLFTDNPIVEALQRTTQRTFDYMTSEDSMATSGREGVYAKAFDIFKDTNYMGEGVCEGITDGYPHNLILEFMMQGGVIYTLIWLTILMWTIYKIHILNKNEKSYILYPLFFYPIIQLLFTGSYLSTPLFWFVISYAFSRTEFVNKLK